MAGVWTRNYTNLMAGFFGNANVTPENSYASGNPEYTSSNLTVRCTNGNYYKVAYASGYYPDYRYQPVGIGAMMNNRFMLLTNNNESVMDYLGVMFGSSSLTGDFYEAYQLANIITSGLSLSNSTPPITCEYDSTNHKYTRTFSLGITNVSNSNITISEVAITAQVSKRGGSAYSTYPAILYYDTFDPITLEPYESIVLTLSQSFPLINYQPYPVG